MATMRFRNFGGIYQFTVATEDDLAKIDTLDPARWAATSAPTPDLHCDTAFLRYLDPDGTKRVRVSQIVAARNWAFARLARKDILRLHTDVFPIEAIDTGDVGKRLRAVADRVNTEQGAADRSKVGLADVRGYKAGYHKLLANGDGVIPPDVVGDVEVAGFIRDAMAMVGSVRDRGGSDGIDKTLLDRFVGQAKAWLDWRAGTVAAGVWGEDTAPAWEIVQALDGRIEAWFLYCDLLRQENPAPEALRLKDDDIRALRVGPTAALEHHLAEAPLAAPVSNGELLLSGPINAVYREKFAVLRTKVLSRALGGRPVLTREAWREIKATLGVYGTWLAAKPQEPMDTLGEERVRAMLSSGLADKVYTLIAQDLAAQAEIDQVDDLEKLLLCVRWLVDLANNVVNFSAIYRPDATALVEKGSLVIDGRRLDFCLLVTDRAAHKAVASESLCFLVYAKITSREGGDTVYEIVAPVTAGEKGRIHVGKRGIFIDLDNKEFDAQVVEIVENPISVREAAFAPFRRAAALIGSKIEEWTSSAAAAQDHALQDRATATVTAARTEVEHTVDPMGTVAGHDAEASPTPVAPAAAATASSAAHPPAARSEGLNINSMVVGGGVALAGLGAILASLFSALTSLKGWVAIFGMIAVVMSISALAGWLKLRRRDMSLILEANGWAVNVHMKITARIAQVFVFTPDLPKESVLDPTDMLPAVEGEGRGRRFVVRVLAVFFVLTLLGIYVLYSARWLPHLSHMSFNP